MGSRVQPVSDLPGLMLLLLQEALPDPQARSGASWALPPQPYPLLGHHSLGPGLSSSLACEARKGRALGHPVSPGHQGRAGGMSEELITRGWGRVHLLLRSVNGMNGDEWKCLALEEEVQNAVCFCLITGSFVPGRYLSLCDNTGANGGLFGSSGYSRGWGLSKA